MCYIMTAEGWQQLSPTCRNEVWEKQSYNALTKQWEPDAATGTLRMTRVDDHAKPSIPPFDEEAYRLSTERWLKNIRAEIKQQRQARLGW